MVSSRPAAATVVWTLGDSGAGTERAAPPRGRLGEVGRLEDSLSGAVVVVVVAGAVEGVGVGVGGLAVGGEVGEGPEQVGAVG